MLIKTIKYQQVVGIIFGLIFLIFGIFSLIYNIPKVLNPDPISYTFYSTHGLFAEYDASRGHYDRTWQRSFPSYSLLFYPPVFILGGLASLASISERTKRLKNFLAGLFTISLGLMLAYLFQYEFPIVLIPIIFVVIGIFIVWMVITKKKKYQIPLD